MQSVFPVEYRAPGAAPEEDGTVWKQGYTCNISRGGICLGINQFEDWLKPRDNRPPRLRLRIRVPLSGPPVEALGEVVWTERAGERIPADFQAGLRFVEIAESDRERLTRYARWSVWAPRLATAAVCVFFALFLVSLRDNLRLQERNAALVDALVTVQQKEARLGGLLETIESRKARLAEDIAEYSREIRTLTARLEEAQEGLRVRTQQEDAMARELKLSEKTIMDLKKTLREMKERRGPLEDEYDLLVRRERMMEDEREMLERQKKGLRDSVWKQMHAWLARHQSSTTGLVKSFEGEVGVIEDWAFIYDQALAVNCFLLAEDVPRAKKILNFFSRMMSQGYAGFYNAYFFDSGEVAEYTVHCGPNIWAGIAAMQYQHKTGDSSYLPLAEAIAGWLIALQDQDPAGGLRGGPDFDWFATEHNLDAYAFFDMLHRLTNKDKYDVARRKTASWLKTYAMVKHSGDYRRPPVNRGRGDATIATDTFAWSLAALGPEMLESLGMDPERIMNFAEEHCGVTVMYPRPSGVEVEVTGFDFARHKHMPRGGMVSPEWTSQMAISFQILADYFSAGGNDMKAVYYRRKASRYLDELNKLIISSPSPLGQGEGCLPYATLEYADTGHGWRTPYGDRTGSVAGTAYMMMAIENFNPLSLKE